MEVRGACIDRYEDSARAGPFGASTFLFGRNGAGKSTLLDARFSGWHRQDAATGAAGILGMDINVTAGVVMH